MEKEINVKLTEKEWLVVLDILSEIEEHPVARHTLYQKLGRQVLLK
jgi:hypothetical protein